MPLFLDYCKRECTKFKQVCGSDGKVYDSHCHMKKTNCLNKGNVTVRYHGTCGIVFLFTLKKCLNTVVYFNRMSNNFCGMNNFCC